MGYSSALDFASQAGVRQGIAWHLQANIYPPAPSYMLDVCCEAVQYCAFDEPAREIMLPKGVTDRHGNDWSTASFIVNSFRLEAFVDYLMQDGDDEEEGL